MRFPFLRVVILIIYRASRITFLRQRTQFADTSAHGRGECPRLYNMCAPIRGQRGKPLGFPLKSQKFAAVSSARISRAEYLLAQAKPRFCVSAPLFANTFAFAGKVNAARILWRALKKRAAKENSDGQRLCRVPWGCPQNLDFLFRQLETKSENLFTAPPARTARRRCSRAKPSCSRIF